MARRAQSGAFGREELWGLARMRNVAEGALAALERQVNRSAFQTSQHRRMAIKTELALGFDQNRFRVARVRVVTGGAVAPGHGPMLS